VPPFIAIILVFGFMDKIQDTYNVPLPGILTMLLGENAVLPTTE
jgi:neurotransmitter:Na+ symporter, NSS family